MSDTTIDNIFAEFGRKCSPVATLKNVDNPLVRREYIDEAKSALYELMLSVIKETKDDPEIYWGNGQKIIENRLKELMK